MSLTTLLNEFKVHLLYYSNCTSEKVVDSKSTSKSKLCKCYNYNAKDVLCTICTVITVLLKVL